MKLHQATRQQARIRLGIQGPSGSGKTQGALQIAIGLANGDWTKIAVIDTEYGSASLYSHLGSYNVVNLTAPFGPDRFSAALKLCEEAGMEVVIMDSISHEWDGSGGILDIHNAMTGNSFTNWGRVTPLHSAFVQSILASPCHVITTIRSKQDYVLTDKNGKMVPEKVGLKGVQRDGIEYELTTLFEIDIKHNVTATKDRTSLFSGKPEFKLTPIIGQKLNDWCNMGELNSQKEKLIKQIEQATTVESLLKLYKDSPGYQSSLHENFSRKRKQLETTRTFPELLHQQNQTVMERMILTKVEAHQEEGAKSLMGETLSTDRAFIQANTVPATLDELRNQHVIPVFKDGECAISQADFIQTVMDVAAQAYFGEQISRPNIRLSHPIKGRIPDAKDKPVNQLQDFEKTVYYERMMFAIEIPTISDEVDGQPVTFVLGGVKAYNNDSLYNRKGVDERFTVFAGHQCRVCTNLSVWSDGFASDIRVKTVEQLRNAVLNMLLTFNPVEQIQRMRSLVDVSLSEKQFAQLIGRCRMFQYLPTKDKEGLDPLLFGDQQIASVCRDYYRDKSFCRNTDGSINLWKLYNLFTGANKSTYIDQFLERSVSASHLVETIRDSLNNTRSSWYLN